MAYYGILVVAMVVTMLHRDLQEALLSSTREGVNCPAFEPVVSAYSEGRIPAAIGITLAVNLFGGSLLYITLPSLVIPYSGLVLGAVRAVCWGILFAPPADPITPAAAARGLLIALLIFLEGQGYVLAMLAAYVQGQAFLSPVSAGVAGHCHGYGVGLRRSLRLYLLVALQLAVAAVYEAILVIVIMPLLA